jgi:hypothetical protein
MDSAHAGAAGQFRKAFQPGSAAGGAELLAAKLPLANWRGSATPAQSRAQNHDKSGVHARIRMLGLVCVSDWDRAVPSPSPRFGRRCDHPWLRWGEGSDDARIVYRPDP